MVFGLFLGGCRESPKVESHEGVQSDAKLRAGDEAQLLGDFADDAFGERFVVVSMPADERVRLPALVPLDEPARSLPRLRDQGQGCGRGSHILVGWTSVHAKDVVALGSRIAIPRAPPTPPSCLDRSQG